MTDQPQPLDLDAIEARANNATPGPWQVDTTEINADIIATGAWIARTDGCNEDAASANAAFIAAARTDVVALVAEVRRLAADVDMWRRTVTRTEQGRDRAIADNDRLATELQQARQQAAREERAHAETIGERDRAAAMADQLAGYIAAIEIVGEHSDMNDPWQNALDHAAEKTAHDPIECDHQAEAGQLAEQVKQLRAALHSIESDAERAARKGYDLDAEDIGATARHALNPAAVSGA